MQRRFPVSIVGIWVGAVPYQLGSDVKIAFHGRVEKRGSSFSVELIDPSAAGQHLKNSL